MKNAGHIVPLPIAATSATTVRHALTVDVEDYFQVSAFEDVVDRTQWDGFARRVDDNTRRLLAMFDEHGVRATFFVLGWVAEREPALVRAIAERGHEIACHGYSHRLVYRQTPNEFANETQRAKAVLEDLLGAPVMGYRAASYSITRQSLWALDILAECGFGYDSSIFPVHHDRYGIPGAPRQIHRVGCGAGDAMIEFPLSSYSLLGQNIPVAGGGYFRFYPYSLTRWLLGQVAQSSPPFVFYLHPWEVDPEQPRIAGARALSRFRHYLNLAQCATRLRKLLSDFPFGTMQAAINALHGGQPERLPVHRYA